MIWFKHDTDATQDAKIKKLLIRYGAIGYAIYFHCLELIAAETSDNNLTFELEHDSEIIAANLFIKDETGKKAVAIVEDIMRFIIEIGLFQESGGRIFCFKLLKRLDASMTSNPRFRAMIASAKGENHDTVMTPSCYRHDTIMQASKQDKQEDKEAVSEDGKPTPRKKFMKPSIQELSEYCKERRNAVSPEKFIDYYESNGWRVGRNPMKDWKAAVRTWERNGLDKDPPKDTINGYKAQDAECPVCRGKIIGTLTTCMRCGYTKGDDTNDPENQAFYKANLERSKIKA